MKTIGFPISRKENEHRRAVTPAHLASLKNAGQLCFERGYGKVLGFSDEDYRQAGGNIVSRDEALSQDIVCDLKIGDAEYLGDLAPRTTIFGWVHAVQNEETADKLIRQKLTAFAMEDMFEDGRHVFWRNNEVAGEAAIIHAYLCHGLMPYDTKAAVIGRGNIGRGASKILNLFGAEVVHYDRKTERLLRKEVSEFDVIVNCVLWDVNRRDHILSNEDLKRMKKGALIIDVSCDRAGGIESSVPTTIESPTYVKDGVTHYVVDHTPSLYYKTISSEVSFAMRGYFDELATGNVGEVLSAAKISENGVILDRKIVEYQKRLGKIQMSDNYSKKITH